MRSAAGISQGELGRLLGTSGRVVWTWEADRTEIPASELPQLAGALGVSVSDLFDEKPASGYRAQLEEAVAQFRRALELRPERIEINVYVAGESQPGPYVPTRADDVTRRVVEEWPDLPEEDRHEWLEFAEQIRARSDA